MKNILLVTALLSLLSLLGCAGSHHGHHAMPSPEDSASLEAYVRDLMEHVGKGDFAYLKRSMCKEAVVYDIDDNGTPIVKRGAAEVSAMLDQYQESLTQPGTGTQLTITSLECDRHAVFCTVEFDQVFTMNGQAMGPMKFRATVVTQRHGDKWIWTHWHASFREAPVVPGPPSQAPAAPAAAPATAPGT